MIERVNLTPEVRPADALLLAQHVDRHDQCDLVVKRTITTSTGQRFFVKQEFEEGFGPLGGDKYILPVEMPRTASLGPARMYSKAYSWCSWLDYIVPSEAEAWTMDFVFADTTITEPRPVSFQNIGVKAARNIPTKPSQPIEGQVQ
ncbi:hypothetical protein [Methylorubrum suomiense]|uniref:Uncharacterized protein n=1 Tax=Methylorubrum suomiense TaxID=144191 RepID=A0ABQ4V0J1_9HYPH|nr:hypothetical protein [Methylorubrum suomiense]GJE78105.1 hypothetical protein BGCPKDLD_4716 [Methylorubrum suomiense]